MKTKIWCMLMLILTALSAKASVIVQWGEPGGTNIVVSGAKNFDNAPTTTYSDAQADVITTTNHYELNPAARSPLFQIASSRSSFQSAQVQNVIAYDRFRVVATTGENPTHMETMVVWDDFLTSDDEVTGFGWYGYSAIADSAELYFIIRKDGSWYATLASSWTGSGVKAIDLTDASAATWHDFTPITGGVGTVGSVAAIEMTSVTAVGTYMVQTDTAGGNLANYNGFFQATAEGSVGGPPEFTSDPLNKPDADEGVAYTNSIAGDVSYTGLDTMTFSLVDAPTWLHIATNGMITGTPASTNVGLNAFSVQVSATGGVDTATMNITVIAAPEPPAPPTGWEEFVTTYGLSGNKFDDADDDDALDVYEYAYGGNPTNPADQGILPAVAYGTNDVVSFITVETTNTNPGITYTAEWTDNLVTGEWAQTWGATNTTTASIPGYNEVEHQINGAAYQKLYFRDRLFSPRPNILVIMCDDLGYSDVGFNRDYSRARWGQQTPLPAHDVNTPNIDSLANGGMIFAQAYVPHMFCGPSRMGIMAGRYPHHIGGLDNLPYETANRPNQDTLDAGWGYEPANEIGGIPTNETTMATVLQDADYYTGMIGKWHMGVEPFAHPNNRGFDHWYGMLGGGHNYNNINNNGTAAAWMSKDDPNVVNDYQFWLTRNAEEEESPMGAYITDLLSDDAVSFITNAPSDEPFFLFLSYTAPHSPMQAKPSDLQARFGGSGDYGDYDDRQNLVAMMDAVDRGVSNVVEALTAEGLLDNTLIVFLSDNGGREAEDDADNNPMKGGKGDAFEGGIRTPMFMHMPSVIPAGSVYDYPMTAYDFYPTFARLAEATIPTNKVIVGKDIWDGITSNSNVHEDETLIWVRYLSAGFNVGLRRNDIKATVGNSNGNWTMNDLSTDIHESGNIISDPGASDVLDVMLTEGQAWSTLGVDPLWFNGESGYTNWVVNGMSNKWDDAFTR